VNANMNGNDWQSVHNIYARLLPLVATRDDLNYLIGQMIGELSSSHTYVGGCDDGQVPAATLTPRLGADLALDATSGRYRITRIYPGDNTRPWNRGPLGWPGLNVREGDYLLAIDGRELATPATAEALLQDKRGAVTLTIAASPEGVRRTVSVLPIQSEYAVRRLAWVQRNRALVARLSAGRVGYIYMADMQNLGMEEFTREFYPQLDKEALVIDDRWNGGGNVDQLVLERLRRTLSSMQTRPHTTDAARPTPDRAKDNADQPLLRF
jgi:tricorn protease